MAPRGFRLAGRGRRQIKGSIGGGGGKGNLKRKTNGSSGTTTTPTPSGPTKTPDVIKDVTQTRTAGGAFTEAGWVNVPGGKVFVLPGDTMSEAIGQGKGLISMAKTEQTRSSGGAYTQGGYVRTGQKGALSVSRVRAGDTRSEVIGAARAASRVTGQDTRSERSGMIRGRETAASRRAAGQATVRQRQAASERTGVGVAPKAAAPKAAAPKATVKAPVKKKTATVVSKAKSTAMRAL